MTAARGIVHSERTGPDERARGPRLHGSQLWVSLPAVALAALWLGCGGSEQADVDASARDGAVTGDGSGTAADLECPDDPVEVGADCELDGHVCAWLGCPEATTIRAECVGGSWSVEDLGCEPRTCGEVGGADCAADELCVIRRGGAYLTECIPGACDGGAIDAPCACEQCGSAACDFQGETVECNSCTGPDPCP